MRSTSSWVGQASVSPVESFSRWYGRGAEPFGRLLKVTKMSSLFLCWAAVLSLLLLIHQEATRGPQTLTCQLGEKQLSSLFSQQPPCETARNCPREKEAHEVWAAEGGRAELPCYMNPQVLGSSLQELYKRVAVRWDIYRKSSCKERHMVLQVEPSGLKKQSGFIKPRATVWDTGFLNGNFSLQIEPVLKADAGSYEALVNYGHEMWQCHLELNVVSVTAAPSHRRLVESTPVRLACNSTYPGSPTRIRWFHAGRLIPATSGRFWSQDQYLFIPRTIPDDSGPWVCELTYTASKRVSATYNLQVLGFAGPTSPIVHAATGSDTQFSCSLNFNPTDYGISEVVVRWTYMVGGKRESQSACYSGKQRTFTLRLSAVQPGAAGQYHCEIRIFGTPITKTITLAVLTVTPSVKGPVMEGSYLLLTCNVSYPTGHEHFQWKRIGLGSTNKSWPEAPSRISEVLSWSQTLEFCQVTPDDAGIWECSVHSPGGMLGSAKHHLEIAGAQITSVPLVTAWKITFGLIILFLLFVIVILAWTLWRQKMHRTNYPALDRKAPAALPWKGVTDRSQEETFLKKAWNEESKA